MDGARAGTSLTRSEDDEKPRKRKHRDAGAVLARKRFENIVKRSAYLRKWTGIINNAEKNKLINCEKQMLKTQKINELKISRYKEQLKQELYEMAAAKKALKLHSVLEEDDRAEQRRKVERYAARGRYQYAIRNETKVQKETMESFNERKDTAKKLLAPARRQSMVALTNGELMGSADPENYLKVGRKLSKIDIRDDLYYSSSDEEDTELVGEVKMSSLLTQQNFDTEGRRRRQKSSKSVGTSPGINLTKLRHELGPELRKQLDAIFIDDPDYQMSPLTRVGTASADSTGQKPTSDDTATSSTIRIDADEGEMEDETDLNVIQEDKEKTPRLKLPPLKADRNILSSIVSRPNVAKPMLSTVAESETIQNSTYN